MLIDLHIEPSLDPQNKSQPSPEDLPNPGIKLGSPALQGDSLPTELSGKPWKKHSPGQNTGMGSLSLLQGIFPTQGSHIAGRFITVWPTRETQNTGVDSLSLLQAIFPTQESNWGPLHCRWILYQPSYQGSPFLQRIKSGKLSHSSLLWFLCVCMSHMVSSSLSLI